MYISFFLELIGLQKASYSQVKRDSRVLRPTKDVFLGGLQAPLLTRKLPRVEEVALDMEHYKLVDKESSGEAKKNVAEDIMTVYMNAFIPTINPLKVVQKMGWVQDLVKERRKDMVKYKRFDKERVMGKHKKKSGSGKKKKRYVEVKDELMRVQSVRKVYGIWYMVLLILKAGIHYMFCT